MSTDGRHCSACPNPQFCRPVRSSGPTPCPVLIVGALPDMLADRLCRPMVGQSGQELDNTYLPLAGLVRDRDVHCCYAQTCYVGSDTVQDGRLSVCAAYHLPALLAAVQPEVVVLMGAAVCRLADPPLRLRVDMHHGVPQYGGLCGGAWEGWIWPSYDPRLGMRETAKMTPLLADWRRLGQWMRGEFAPRAVSPVRADYSLITMGSELDDYLERQPDCSYSLYGYQAVDTESHGAESWSVQISHTPHTGRMIRATDKHLLAAYAHAVAASKVEAVMHFANHDLDECDRMGIQYASYRDTMQEAYQQCDLPQGLKALAYRLLGVTMRSWEDVVRPASVRAIIDWMEDGIALASTGLADTTVTHMLTWTCADCGHRIKHPQAECEVSVGPWMHSGKGGACQSKVGSGKCGCTCPSNRASNTKVVHRPSGVESVLRHVLSYTARTEDDDKPYDPWVALAEMRVAGLRGKVAEPWEWEWLEHELGSAPILGIGNCDLQEAVIYGCSDSDHTLQVEQALEQRRQSDHWKIDRSDYDK